MCITRWKHPAGTPAIWQTSQTLPNLFKPTVTAQSIFSQSCKMLKCQATRLILGNILTHHPAANLVWEQFSADSIDRYLDQRYIHVNKWPTE